MPTEDWPLAEEVAEIGRRFGAHGLDEVTIRVPYVVAMWISGMLTRGMDRGLASGDASHEAFYTAAIEAISAASLGVTRLVTQTRGPR